VRLGCDSGLERRLAFTTEVAEDVGVDRSRQLLVRPTLQLSLILKRSIGSGTPTDMAIQQGHDSQRSGPTQQLIAHFTLLGPRLLGASISVYVPMHGLLVLEMVVLLPRCPVDLR